MKPEIRSQIWQPRKKMNVTDMVELVEADVNLKRIRFHAVQECLLNEHYLHERLLHHIWMKGIEMVRWLTSGEKELRRWSATAWRLCSTRVLRESMTVSWGFSLNVPLLSALAADRDAASSKLTCRYSVSISFSRVLASAGRSGADTLDRANTEKTQQC